MPICCIQYIKDAMYLPVERKPDMMRRSHSRQDIVFFVQILSPRSRSELNRHCVAAFKALRNVDRGEKLHLSYGREYTILNVMSSTENR